MDRVTLVLGFVIIALLAAYVPNGIVWVIFGAGVLILVIAGYSLMVRAFGKQSELYLLNWGKPMPWWVDATWLFVAVVVIISAAPGLLFNQPHWAIDHLWYLIGRLFGDKS